MRSVLASLAQRVGYAVRKAQPHLDSCRKVRLLQPLIEVLDDLGIELRPAGDVHVALSIAPPGVHQECQLLAVLAGLQQRQPSDGSEDDFHSLESTVAGQEGTSRLCADPMASCPLQDDAILAVQHHSMLFAHSDVTKFDLEMLNMPVVPPPPSPIVATPPKHYSNAMSFVIVEVVEPACGLLDAQADTIARLCGHIDDLASQYLVIDNDEDVGEHNWNVHAETISPSCSLPAETPWEPLPLGMPVLPVICTCCTYHEGKNVGTILCESCLPGIDDIAAFFLGLPPEPLPPEAGGVPMDCQQQ